MFTKKSIKKILRRTIPLSLALLIAFNTTLGVALIQYYFYKRTLNELVAYKEKLDNELANTAERKSERLRAEVFSESGVNIGVKWEDLGKRLVETGVIDEDKFLSLFKFSGERARYKNLFDNNSAEYIILNESNSRFVLNMLWALGLTQNSKVLTDMQNNYDKVANLASTGGWTLGNAKAMKFYGKNNIVNLTEEQQQLVFDITKNIYRPCCNNHAAFADCNHGMAMLGLVELMIANGYSKDEVYNTALKVNSYWFPDTYMTLANYFESNKDTKWKDVDAKLVLGKDFSSASGYRNAKTQVQPLFRSGGGGGCGV